MKYKHGPKLNTKTTLVKHHRKYYRTAVPVWLVENILGCGAGDKIHWRVAQGKVWLEKVK